MLKKFRLKKSDEYDCIVATLYASEMLVAYLDKRMHHQCFGGEQGDIEHWDDIIIDAYDGAVICCQVKRQTGPFSNDKIARALKSKGENKGDLQNLSELDKAFESLGKYFSLSKYEREKQKRKFRLVLPEAAVNIKRDLTISQLRDLTEECRLDGVSVEKIFARGDGVVNSVRGWLINWCGFSDNEQIFDCLSQVEIDCVGAEAELSRRIRQYLENWYLPSDDVRAKIQQYIKQQASVSGSLTPRLVASQLLPSLRPDKRLWAQYVMRTESSWRVAGTLSTETPEMEPPPIVVQKLWTPSSARTAELQLNYDCPSQGIEGHSLNHPLVRLAVHAKSAAISARNPSLWRVEVARFLRETLGKSEDELEDIGWLDIIEATESSEHRPIDGMLCVESEMSALSDSMTFHTWTQVKEAVENKIFKLPSTGDLRSSVFAVWNAWKGQIDVQPAVQSDVLSEMLYAVSEGDRYIGTLRAGPRTVPLLVNAFFMLLLVTTALDGDTACWGTLSAMPLKVVALRFWGGPRQHKASARKLIEDDSAGDRQGFFGPEPAAVLILPEVSSPLLEAIGSSFASDADSFDNMMQPRRPKIILTSSSSYKEAYSQALVTASIEPIRAFLKKQIAQRESVRSNNIERTAVS